MTKILIVDDKEQDRYLLHVLLSSNKFQVETASNGVEALEIARRSQPELIVSDILMPVMDGFSLCRNWKEDAQLKNIPFVFYTATYTDSKDEDFALSLGAERFIVKPKEPDAFVKTIREVLENHEKGKLVALREPTAEEAVYFKEYNAVLIRKLEAKVLQLKRANQRLIALFQVSNGLTTLRPADELILLALRAIVEMVGFQAANYFNYDKNQSKLFLQKAVGFSDEDLAVIKEKMVFTLGEERGLVGMVAKTREALIVAETMNEPRWVKLDDTTHSALFVPVLYEDRLLGVLTILSREADSFDQEEVKDLTTLANNLAIAIENTQLLEQVQRSELYYRTILESTDDAIMSIDPELKIRVWNSGAERIFGYTKEEITGQSLDLLLPAKEEATTEELFGKARKEGFERDFQTSWRAKDGGLVDVELTLTYLGPEMGFTAILHDITVRKQTENSLRKALSEKEVLLHEVHHRVKNNLQSIIYLIENRAEQISDEQTVLMLKTLQEQARTMALVYEQLFQSENLAQVCMKSYLSELAEKVKVSFDPRDRVELTTKCDDILFDVNNATPCGLIVTELITNALKHAFPPQFKGIPRILTSLTEHDDLYELVVHDNGIGGLPDENDWQTEQSMGLKLVKLWTTHQMGGTLEVKTGDGTTFHVKFMKNT